MSNTLRTVLGGVARSYVPFVVLGLVVGLTLAPVAWQAAESDGTVAVVPVAGTIDGNTASEYSAMMQHARQDPDVKAVVLVANSGGGAASASESMYLETKRTAREMPVVTSVDSTAASGAYYTIVPSDRIFVKPSSVVGSVGVLATAPDDVEPNDIIATTGPNKLSGGDQREFYSIVESLGEAFYNAVMEGRGDALTLSRTQLSQARVYAGTQAVENGIADEIGGREAAIAYAAKQAGMTDYDVTVLRPDGPVRFVSRSNYLGADVPNKTMVDPSYLLDDGSSAPVFLMMPGTYLSDAAGTDRIVADAAAGSRGTATPTTSEAATTNASEVATATGTEGEPGPGGTARIARPPGVIG